MTSPAAPPPGPSSSAPSDSSTSSVPPAFTPTHKSGELDRRTIWISAAVLFGVLIIGIGAMALFADPGSEPGPTTTADGSPHIIDRPNSGTKPVRNGDRGGWEQLALLGVIVVAVGGIGYVAFRGGSKARANREQWKQAAASGRDGALDT